MNSHSQKRDFSLTGAAIVIVSQILSSFGSSGKLSSEIQQFREEFQQSIVDRDTYFARKAEITKLSQKIDEINSRIGKISTQLKSIRSDFTLNKSDLDIVGCSFKERI